jgi:hypothetical protein
MRTKNRLSIINNLIKIEKAMEIIDEQI